MFYELPTELPGEAHPERRRFRPWMGAALAVALLATGLVIRACRKTPETQGPEATTPPQAALPQTPTAPKRLRIAFPTDQRDLQKTDSIEVYMPTASGRVESAMFGSVRTGESGHASFHEGIDIAPVRRDARGAPLDEVRAVADGTVAHANRIAGNSNYGIYVVLLHDDAAGKFYTLYAHLARVESWVKPGQPVTRGARIAQMGNTASTGIPMVRAHLHLEAGMVLNMRFQDWYRARRESPDHGNFHGHNLTGIQPLKLFPNAPLESDFSMAGYLAKDATEAFTLAVKTKGSIDYFRRHPTLWKGGSSARAVISFSESGVPIRGREATPEEAALLARANHAVVSVNEEALGRNGKRLVTRSQGKWTLSQEGQRMVEILTY